VWLNRQGGWSDLCGYGVSKSRPVGSISGYRGEAVRNTRLVLEEAETNGILPREAAVDLALQRLKKSMSYIIDAGRGFRQLLGSYSQR
jgi:hypothetical protein